MQRFFDIFFSLLALLVLLPFLIPIIILLRLTGEGEVFYLQDRIGRDGKKFQLFKFATMLKNSPAIGTGTVTIKDDPRILPAGKFLRKTKINELPQLLNVLFGDMSVVGPRPLTVQTFGAYPAEVQDVVKRMRPGLSGVGSIIFRGEEDILAGGNGSFDFYKDVIAPYKGALEVWYAENCTLLNYFKVIFVTVVVVVRSESQIAWATFKGLPSPPPQLAKLLNYPN